jgi:predicted helicase
MALYWAPLFVDRPGRFREFFPTAKAVTENRLLCVNLSPERPFNTLSCNLVPSKDVAGGFGSPSYCFPLYTYSSDGKERRDNIPLSSLVHFQTRFDDDSITRLDIFYYVYAVLHHPDYRARYADNLKRELPRIPLIGKVKDFRAFAEAGQELAKLHVNYEQQPEYPLKHIEIRDTKLDWRVDAMRLTKDRDALIYNAHFTLEGIPAGAFEYRLGNRSALEWVVDQYRVTRDKDGEIVSDPNRPADEQYIMRLVGRVITVSVQTQRIVNALSKLPI